MIGLNAGLEIARKALSAYQLAINIHSSNIANVNTPGYSRRQPIFAEGTPSNLSVGRIGLGVDAQSIRRMRDTFLDSAYRGESSSYSRSDVLEQSLSEIEMVFNEPSGVGLGTALDEFWSGWQELANQPESTTARSLVLARGKTLCGSLNRMAGQFKSMREDLDREVVGQVDAVNNITSEIALLNGQIVEAEASGIEASDLRDRRDLMLDRLSEMVNIRAFEGSDGAVAVKLGAETLVERSTAVRLGVTKRGSDGVVVSDVTIGSGERVVSIQGGRLGGLLESRDRDIPHYLGHLDDLAATVVARVNEVHRSGYGLDGSGGRDFFDPSGVTAETISVSDAIAVGENLDLIAASADGTPGNSEIALAIADIRLERIFGSDSGTSKDYYSAVVGELGSEVSSATTEKEGRALLLQETDTRRESVKGVSIDEETTGLLASQHAYQAAVKLVSVVDELMENLLQAF
jgi:flagellar hook-associated protein 1 FlgK